MNYFTLDLVAEPSARIGDYLGRHTFGFITASVAVIAAIVIIIVMIKKSKRGK